MSENMAEHTTTKRKSSDGPKNDVGLDPKRLHLQWLLDLHNRRNKVRVEVPDYWDAKCRTDVFPKSITQLYPTKAHYKLKNSIMDLADVDLLLREKFPSWTSVTENLNINWPDLKKLLKEADYRKELDMVDTSQWKAHGPEGELLTDTDMKRILGYLRLAIATGFQNGEVKSLVRMVCNQIIKETDSVKLHLLEVESPPPNSLLVSRVVQDEFDEEFDDERLSLDSSTCSLESQKNATKEGFVVPDVVVYHPILPLFLLSVECQKVLDNEDRGIVQCLHQLLSHMHHQDLHFGFVINPHKWRLIVVHKNEETRSISVMQEEEPLLVISSCRKYNTFNVESLFRLFNWIKKALVFECSRIPR